MAQSLVTSIPRSNRANNIQTTFNPVQAIIRSVAPCHKMRDGLGKARIIPAHARHNQLQRIHPLLEITNVLPGRVHYGADMSEMFQNKVVTHLVYIARCSGMFHT